MIIFRNSKLDLNLQGLSEPDFYGDLVYKLKKIVGSVESLSLLYLLGISSSILGYMF